MKKFLSLLFVVAALMIATPSDAQVRFGIKGGLNVSDMSLSKDVLESSNRLGFFVGPTLKVTLPLTGLSADISALYNQSESKIDDETISRKYIDIPLNARYGLGFGSIGVFAYAGPQVSFNVGDDEFSWTSSDSYKNSFQLKKSLFSVNVGAGVTVSSLQLTANYNIAVGKTGDVSLGEAVNTVIGTKARANSWQIGLAYFF